MSRKYRTLVVFTLLFTWVAQLDAATGNSKFDQAGSFRVYAVIDPETPRVGRNKIQLRLQDGAGNAISSATLDVVAVMPAMGSMPAMYAPAEMTETDTGLYEGYFSPAMAGEWPFTIKI